MEEPITEEGNPCLTTEQEVQGCGRCGSLQLGEAWPTHLVLSGLRRAATGNGPERTRCRRVDRAG
jgi:hypothetical protein